MLILGTTNSNLQLLKVMSIYFKMLELQNKTAVKFAMSAFSKAVVSSDLDAIAKKSEQKLYSNCNKYLCSRI